MKKIILLAAFAVMFTGCVSGEVQTNIDTYIEKKAKLTKFTRDLKCKRDCIAACDTILDTINKVDCAASCLESCNGKSK